MSAFDPRFPVLCERLRRLGVAIFTSEWWALVGLLAFLRLGMKVLLGGGL